MPAHTTLSSLFTDIANAIRAKDGSSATIMADNFPAKILDIPTGGGGGEYTIYPSATEPSAAQNGDIWIDYSGDLVAKNFQISSDPVNTTSTTLTETAMAITVTKTGIYNVYACVGYNRNSGTAQFLVKKNGTTDIIATTNISTTAGNCGKALNVSLNAGDVLKVWLKSASSSYRAFATALIITEV